jgi:hypothetical protein
MRCVAVRSVAVRAVGVSFVDMPCIDVRSISSVMVMFQEWMGSIKKRSSKWMIERSPSELENGITVDN